MNAYSLLTIALLLNAAANLLMKYAAARTPPAAEGIAGLLQTYLTWPFIAGLVCFGLNVLVYTQALKRLPISTAYPLMVSLGYLVILIVSFFLFQERLTLPKYFGAAMMLAGLWLLVR